MKKAIEQMYRLLEHNNISLLEGEKKLDTGNKTKDHESFHALKAVFSQSQDFLIDSRASNHMVSSKESFSSLDLSRGPMIHMGYDSQLSGKIPSHLSMECSIMFSISLT